MAVHRNFFMVVSLLENVDKAFQILGVKKVEIFRKFPYEKLLNLVFFRQCSLYKEISTKIYQSGQNERAVLKELNTYFSSRYFLDYATHLMHLVQWLRRFDLFVS